MMNYYQKIIQSVYLPMQCNSFFHMSELTLRSFAVAQTYWHWSVINLQGNFLFSVIYTILTSKVNSVSFGLSSEKFIILFQIGLNFGRTVFPYYSRCATLYTWQVGLCLQDT